MSTNEMILNEIIQAAETFAQQVIPLVPWYKQHRERTQVQELTIAMTDVFLRIMERKQQGRCGRIE